MRPVPQPIRDQIVAACDAGEKRTAIAQKFGVCTAFIRRLLQNRREHGTYAAKPHGGGRKPAIRGQSLGKLKSFVKAHPAATVKELADEMDTSPAAVCRALQRIGWTVKEGRYTQPERQRFRSPFDRPIYETALGRLYEADCLTILPRLEAGSVDMVFADPPFNLGKKYGRKAKDRRPNGEYLHWCEKWLDECIRVLKPGGALFLYHIPKMAMQLGTLLMSRGLVFQNWIAIDFNLGMPLPDRLSPRHYALLYLTKGKPKTFNVVRTPIQTCRHCGGDVKDYGGHRDQVHADGVRLTDVWTDISAVRHAKYRHREANQLPTKLVARCVELTTRPGDVVLDPMAGAGTTCEVCERTGRKWIGIEIESVAGIIQRLRRLHRRELESNQMRKDLVLPQGRICEGAGCLI